MYRNMKENYSYKKMMLLFFALFVSFIVTSVFVGDLFLPICAALLGVCLLFDKTKFKWLPLSILALLCVGSAFISLPSLVLVLTSFFCALILYLGYYKNLSKAEISVYLTVLYAICTVACFYFFGAKEIGSFDISKVIAYYNSLFDGFVKDLVEQMKITLEGAVANSQQPGVDQAEFLKVFEESLRSFSSLVLSLVAIVAFFYAGVQIKVFSFIVSRVEENPRDRKSWHFSLPNIFAYFYIVLALISPFVGVTSGVVGLAIANLYNIFLFVFAYIGFNYAWYLVSRMRKKALARFLLIAILFTSSMLAIQILSFAGVFVTTMHNKFIRMNDGGGSDSPQE